MTPELEAALVAQAARARRLVLPQPALSIAPGLEIAIADEVAHWKLQFGDDGRVGRYAVALVVDAFAHNPLVGDGEAIIDADWLLARTEEVEDPSDDDPVGQMVSDLKKVGADTLAPGARLSVFAAEMYRAFYWTSGMLRRWSAGKNEPFRQDSSRTKEEFEFMNTLVKEQVERRMRNGAAFDRPADEIASDMVQRLGRLPNGYRARGIGDSFVAFLRKHIYLRLDNERRAVGGAGGPVVSMRWVRAQRARGSIGKDDPLTAELVDSLRKSSGRAQRSAVPEGSVNSKGLQTMLVGYQTRGFLSGVPVGQRSVDKLVASYEQHRGAPFERVGRSKRIPGGEIEALAVFAAGKTRRR